MPNKIENSKVWFWVILDVVLMSVIVLALISAKALWRYGRSVQPENTIIVSSEGKTTAVPDLAAVSFSVVAEGSDPVKLQNDNNTKINDAIVFVKSQGIEAKDIKTTGYNLSPKYVYSPKTGKNYIDGYILTQSVQVKIRDFTKIGVILGALPKKGINDLNGPNFSIEDPDKFLNQARQEAFKKARAKAEAMAGYAGARLGRVVTFSENTGGYPIPFYAEASGFSKGGPIAPPAPTIEPGSQDVTVNVSVTYELE